MALIDAMIVRGVLCQPLDMWTQEVIFVWHNSFDLFPADPAGDKEHFGISRRLRRLFWFVSFHLKSRRAARGVGLPAL